MTGFQAVTCSGMPWGQFPGRQGPDSAFGNQAQDVGNAVIAVCGCCVSWGVWFWSSCLSSEMPLLLYRKHLDLGPEASG